jgi:hypothetical protein
MSPRHFSKMMQSPYFQTDHYKNETFAGKLEQKIILKFYNAIYIIKKKILFRNH